MKRTRRHTIEERAAIIARFREMRANRPTSISDCVRALGIPKATLLRWDAQARGDAPTVLPGRRPKGETEPRFTQFPNA